MGRQPRMEYEGAVFHVIARGNNKARIFDEDVDKGYYLKLLKEVKEKFGFSLYAYVLMDNHVHLLIRREKTSLGTIIHSLHGSYSKFYNWKYKRIGHLFQDRYKSFLCKEDAHLLALVRYIHLNPVEAGLVNSPGEYRWSSHGLYINKANNPLIDSRFVLKLFSESPQAAVISYQKWLGEDPKKDQPLMNCYVLDDPAEISAAAYKRTKEATLEELCQCVCRQKGITLSEILGESRQAELTQARSQVARTALKENGYSLKEIADFFQKSSSTISRWLEQSKVD